MGEFAIFIADFSAGRDSPPAQVKGREEHDPEKRLPVFGHDHARENVVTA